MVGVFEWPAVRGSKAMHRLPDSAKDDYFTSATDDRRRRGGPEGPPSNDHQDKLQMIARIKGQEKRFRTPKRTNKPPTHPTTTSSTKATTRSYGVRSSRSGLLRHQTGASL